MATSKDLESRAKRARLAPKGKPYVTRISPGLRLGYRRLASGDGTWSVLIADGKGGNRLERLGVADDSADANGTDALSYWEAVDAARKAAGGGDDRPVTVARAIEDYEANLRSRGGELGNVSRIRLHTPDALARKLVASLKPRDLQRWRDGMVTAGLKPATADRISRVMKAALSAAAAADARIVSQNAWRTGLARLPDSEGARNVILDEAVIRTIVAGANAISTAFGRFVETMAVTGARQGQLFRLEIGDLLDGGATPRLMMPSSKKGRRRHVTRQPVPIPAGLASKLRQAANGREAEAPLLVDETGAPCRPRWVQRDWAWLQKRLRLGADVVPYALRHSSIVRQILRGVPLRIVAVMHDTGVVPIEKNYSRHIAGVGDAAVRGAMLDLDAQPARKSLPRTRTRS